MSSSAGPCPEPRSTLLSYPEDHPPPERGGGARAFLLCLPWAGVPREGTRPVLRGFGWNTHFSPLKSRTAPGKPLPFTLSPPVGRSSRAGVGIAPSLDSWQLSAPTTPLPSPGRRHRGHFTQRPPHLGFQRASSFGGARSLAVHHRGSGGEEQMLLAPHAVLELLNNSGVMDNGSTLISSRAVGGSGACGCSLG